MNGHRVVSLGKFVVLLMLLGVSSIVLADTVTVSIVNSQAAAIFVSFTTLTQAPGVITWNSSGSGCVNTGKSANAAYTQINAGQTCVASVDTSNSSSRFCAALNAAPANCMNAQAQHLTMVETNFEAASNPGCFNSGAACVVVRHQRHPLHLHRHSLETEPMLQYRRRFLQFTGDLGL